MTHMLVDQNDADVLALRREPLERGLDGLGLGLAVDDEEVLLRVGRVRDVLFFFLGYPLSVSHHYITNPPPHQIVSARPALPCPAWPQKEIE